MAREFNYKRAWDELAKPEYDRLPTEFHDFYAAVAAQARLDVEVTKDSPEVRALAEKFDPPTLAWAATVIYFWGHWAYGSGGPNNRQDVGAYWRVQKALHELLRELRPDKRPVIDLLREKFPDSLWVKMELESGTLFMDHEPGTDWSRDELPDRYQSLVAGAFKIRKVDACNYKPHPYVVGNRHVEVASDRYGGMLGEEVCREVPCAWREQGLRGDRCSLSYDEHTYDVVMFLQLERNLENKEAAGFLFALKTKFEEDKVRVDGFAFVEHPKKYRIAPPAADAEHTEEVKS